MKVLGVNFSHNCSFAYMEDGILKEYYEEDRFNKIKHFRPPDCFYGDYQYFILKKFKHIVFDAVVFSSPGIQNIYYEKLMIDNILKQVTCNNVKLYNNQHHIHHALSGFYFSNFEKAIAIICDGSGEQLNDKYLTLFRAIESIYEVNKKEIKCHFQCFSNWATDYFQLNKENLKKQNIKKDGVDILLTNGLIGGQKYAIRRRQAGFKGKQEGQLMGIAAYKDKNTNLDKEVLEIAHKAQEETLEERIKQIERAMTYSDCKNIILSGGYHLNCANNFKLVKHFPELNFFVDPIPYDGGTAVGAAYYYANFEN